MALYIEYIYICKLIKKVLPFYMQGRTTLALMSTLLEGVAIYIQNIEFTYYSDDPGSIKELQTQISPSLRQMFEWSSNKCVLKPLEMGPSLSELRCANLKMIKSKNKQITCSLHMI